MRIKNYPRLCRHPDKAHRLGCQFVSRRAIVRRQLADIVITSNGGYPLDQNIYQAVKGMTSAEPVCVKAASSSWWPPAKTATAVKLFTAVCRSENTAGSNG